MSTYFPTVPIEVARHKTRNSGTERPRPLVLIVDDEPLIAETLAAILTHSGLSAMTAVNGFKALEIVALTPPDLLITDLAMPGMNGLDLAVEVSRSVPDCEIILFSGQAANLAASLSASTEDFVTLIKPIHPTELLARVFECLSRRGITVLPPPREHQGSVAPHSHGSYLRAGHVTMRQRLRSGSSFI